VLRSLDALFESRKHPGGFFSLATVVSVIAVMYMFLSGMPREDFMPYLMLLLPLGFFANVFFTFNSVEYLRSRIYPFEGKLLMHQIPSLNASLDIKALCGHLASALIPIYVWIFFKAMVDYVFGGTGARVVNSPLAPRYPKPVPPIGFMLAGFLFSGVASVMGYMVHSGSLHPMYIVVVCFVIPGILAMFTLIVGNGFDVMRFLGEDNNSFIISPDLLTHATMPDADPALKSALIESVKLDEALRPGLNNETPLPDRFY